MSGTHHHSPDYDHAAECARYWVSRATMYPGWSVDQVIAHESTLPIPCRSCGVTFTPYVVTVGPARELDEYADYCRSCVAWVTDDDARPVAS